MAIGSDNAFPKIVFSEGSVPANPSTGQQKLYIDSADHKLKRVNSSGSVTTVEGGGGSTIKDARWTAQTGETSIDEFNDNSLDAAWIRVDGTGAASGNITWTAGADVLSAFNAGGDTTDKFHALLRPLSGAGGSMSAGDAFITCVDLFAPVSTNFSFAGLVLSDGVTFGSGQQVWAEYGTSASGSQMQVFGWSGFGTAGTNAGALPATLPIQKIFIRLVMTAANTWRADYSHDGVSWWKGTATLSKTMTPTYVGFFDSSYGSSTKHIVSYEFLRRVSGVS